MAVALADILARLDAMEQAVAQLLRAHQQPAAPRRQSSDSVQTLDYNAF